MSTYCSTPAANPLSAPADGGQTPVTGADPRETIERWAATHWSALHASARRVVGDASDAEDALQEALLRALRSADRFTPGTNQHAWIRRIMTNVHLNELRRRRRERVAIDALSSQTTSSVSGRNSAQLASPEEAYARRSVTLRVRTAIEQLPDHVRETVILAELDGLQHREISERIKCPVGTVMSRLYRGRRMLRRHLVRCAVDEQVDRRSAAARVA